MTENSYSATLEIQNRKGLHARAAAAFVKAIEDFVLEKKQGNRAKSQRLFHHGINDAGRSQRHDD